MFLVKPIFFRYFRKFLVTTSSSEMTKGSIDTLLSFQIFLISRAKFSYFVIFSASVLGRLWVKGTAICITNAFEIYCFICYHLSQHRVLLADSNTSSGLYL